MPIQQPDSHSKSIFVASAGVVAAIVINQLRSHTSPVGGDPYHKLPYGGLYKDGTKSINYYPPGWKSPIGAETNSQFGVFLVVILIIFVLRLLYNKERGPACRCSCNH
uniref:Movement protein TGB2 n=1 Tax=Caper carlavirus 1 TaxID=2794419 RepID=A0A7T5QZB9_9VIRU|nr:TGB2 [Caper carlavirus 1]